MPEIRNPFLTFYNAIDLTSEEEADEDAEGEEDDPKSLDSGSESSDFECLGSDLAQESDRPFEESKSDSSTDMKAVPQETTTKSSKSKPETTEKKVLRDPIDLPLGEEYVVLLESQVADLKAELAATKSKLQTFAEERDSIVKLFEKMKSVPDGPQCDSAISMDSDKGQGNESDLTGTIQDALDSNSRLKDELEKLKYEVSLDNALRLAGPLLTKPTISKASILW